MSHLGESYACLGFLQIFILPSFCMTSARLERYRVGGAVLDMLPLPAAYIMDLQEAWKASGLRAFPSKFPDLDCMVPKAELNEARKSFAARTEKKMQSVSRLAALM